MEVIENEPFPGFRLRAIAGSHHSRDSRKRSERGISRESGLQRWFRCTLVLIRESKTAIPGRVVGAQDAKKEILDITSPIPVFADRFRLPLGGGQIDETGSQTTVQ